MPRNSSGNYTLPAGNPVVSGTIIEASWANDTLTDMATAMTDSLSRSGEGGMTAPLRVVDGTAAVPSVAFANETNSGIYRSAAGDYYLVVQGAGIFRLQPTGVTVTGNLNVTGNLTFSGPLSGLTLTGDLAVGGNTSLTGQTLSITNSTAYFPQTISKNKTADANASYYVFDKDRAGAAVQNSDILGNVIFRGFDGTNYVQGASIIAKVAGTPGTNDMPGSLSLLTTADGESAPTERLFIAPSGQTVARAAIQEKYNAIGASAIDLNVGNYFSKTISGTTTFTVSNVPASGTATSFILDLTNGGSSTINWWSGMKWAGGKAPTLTASGRDVLGFYTWDGGTTWTGLVLGKDVK